MTKKITMNVLPDGSSKISVEGYEGGTCIDATQAFEALFSKVVEPRRAVDDCAAAQDKGARVRI
jgi:hypothetical protein